MDIFLFVISFILLILNILVIIKLIKSSYFSKNQKIFQSIFIFILPFFGAFIVWYIIKSTTIKYQPAKGPFGGGSNFKW